MMMKKLFALLVVLGMFSGIAAAVELEYYVNEDFNDFAVGAFTGGTFDGVAWGRGFSRTTAMGNVWDSGVIGGSTGKTLGFLGTGNGSVGADFVTASPQWVEVMFTPHSLGDGYVKIISTHDDITGAIGIDVTVSATALTVNGVTVATEGLDGGAGAAWFDLRINQIFDPVGNGGTGSVDLDIYLGDTYIDTASLDVLSAYNYQSMGTLAFDTYSAGGGIILDTVKVYSEIPEPATMSLLAIGTIAGLMRRRK